MTADPLARGKVARVDLPASAPAWAVLDEYLRGLTGEVRVLVVRLTPGRVPEPAGVSAARTRVVEKLASADLVSVAVVGDPVGAAGTALACACDLRVLGARAEFRIDNVAIFGALVPLARLVGYPRALELTLTGRRMSAREAESFGLANLVVGGDQIDDAVDDLIAVLLATPRDAAAEIKAALRAASAASGLDGLAPRGRISDELDAARRLARDDE